MPFDPTLTSKRVSGILMSGAPRATTSTSRIRDDTARTVTFYGAADFEAQVV